MCRKLVVKIISLITIIVMCTSFIGCSEDEVEVGTKENIEDKKGPDYIPKETVTLNMVCDTCSASGLQQGWFADILLEKFNVKLNYVYLAGDIKDKVRYTGDYDFIFTGNCEGEAFTTALKNGEILNMSSYDMDKYMPYFKYNMDELLFKSEEGLEDVYGIYAQTSTSNSFETSSCTWDMRFDYYEELGKPEIIDINDWIEVLEQMHDAHPDTYALSYSVDEGILENVSSFVSGYYGYEFNEIGFTDWRNNLFYGVLDKTDDGEYGPYLEMLKINNQLYNKGLIDPEYESQTSTDCFEKISNGKTLVGIQCWMGSLTNENMYPVIPANASISHYSLGINQQKCMAIDSETKYPELCMAIINYFYTPEGYLTLLYGPKGDIWNYNEDGKMYLTELGVQCCENGRDTQYKEESYWNGSPQFNMLPYTIDTINTDNNETYNYDNWESNKKTFNNDVGTAWGEWVGHDSIIEYMRAIKPYSLIGIRDIDYLSLTEYADKYAEVKNIINTKSWEAIKAETDDEFDRIVNEMIEQAKNAGYEDCVNYYKITLH